MAHQTFCLKQHYSKEFSVQPYVDEASSILFYISDILPGHEQAPLPLKQRDLIFKIATLPYSNVVK